MFYTCEAPSSSMALLDALPELILIRFSIRARCRRFGRQLGELLVCHVFHRDGMENPTFSSSPTLVQANGNLTGKGGVVDVEAGLPHCLLSHACTVQALVNDDLADRGNEAVPRRSHPTSDATQATENDG